MDIKFRVVGQKLMMLTKYNKFVSDAKDFMYLIFDLPREWAGYAVTAEFVQDSKTISKSLNRGSGVYFPSELSAGICLLALRGTNSGSIVTTDSIALYIDKYVGSDRSGGSGDSYITVELAEPTISVDQNGVVTATVNQEEGYVVKSSKQSSLRLPTHSGGSIVPEKNNKVAVQSGMYTTGDVIVAGDENLDPSNIRKGATIFNVPGEYEGSVGVDLPTINNPAYDEHVFANKEYINADGVKMTGNFTIDDELTEQDSLINQITEALKNKASDNGVADINATNVDRIHSLNDGDRKTVRAMVSFIDDDCRSETYSKLFSAIYDDTNKVLKFPYALACPPASIGGSGYMAQADLLEMYNAGVNIVCHHRKEYNMDQFATADAYDADLTEALEMFKEMGISDVCSVAYPQGQYLEDYIHIVKKHFKMGFTVERGINQIPYESFYMKRCELFPTDGSFTLDKAKALVDQLAVDGGWLIFMTHAWYTDTFDTEKLLELAEYIQETKQIPIVGVNDAIKATGNVIDIGHFRKPLEERNEPFFVVDANGKTWTNAVNIYDRSGQKITTIKPQYHTESYLTPSGNVRWKEDDEDGRIASDLVEVKPGETYLLTCSSLYALAAYVIYLADGTVVAHVVSNTNAAIEGDTVLTNVERVMPENATGLRVMSVLKNQPNGFEIKKVETVERSDDVTPYVRKDELPAAINTALEQAKESRPDLVIGLNVANTKVKSDDNNTNSARNLSRMTIDDVSIVSGSVSAVAEKVRQGLPVKVLLHNIHFYWDDMWYQNVGEANDVMVFNRATYPNENATCLCVVFFLSDCGISATGPCLVRFNFDIATETPSDYLFNRLVLE